MITVEDVFDIYRIQWTLHFKRPRRSPKNFKVYFNRLRKDKQVVLLKLTKLKGSFWKNVNLHDYFKVGFVLNYDLEDMLEPSIIEKYKIHTMRMMKSKKDFLKSCEESIRNLNIHKGVCPVDLFFERKISLFILNVLIKIGLVNINPIDNNSANIDLLLKGYEDGFEEDLKKITTRKYSRMVDILKAI